MKKPVSRVLVINDEKLILKAFVKGLNAAAKSIENPFGIIFCGVTTAHEALQSIEQDGDIQALVVDDKLYTLDSGNRHARHLQMTALELVQKISLIRPELNIYVLIAQEREGEVVDALFPKPWMAISTVKNRITVVSTAFSTPRSRKKRARPFTIN